MCKMNINEMREIKQLTIDYVFAFKNDEYIDTFEIRAMNRNRVIVRYSFDDNMYDEFTIRHMRDALKNK